MKGDRKYGRGGGGERVRQGIRGRHTYTQTQIDREIETEIDRETETDRE